MNLSSRGNVKTLVFVIAIIATLSTNGWSGASSDESFGEMIGRDFASPVTTPAWIPLAIGSAATLTLYAFKYEVGDPLQASWSTRKPLGSTSKWGDDLGQGIPNFAYIIGMAIDGWGFDHKKSKARSVLMLKAYAYSGVSAIGLKYVFREPRPNGSNDMASFPSGHATTAFAFASVIGAEHEWYWAVPAYAMAAFVGASRINDNMHRLHDVVGGATLGMSYGLGLYYRSHPLEAPGEKPTTVYQVLPTDRMDGMQISFLHEF